MARHLNYNPGRDTIEYLDAITHGENRLYILDQLLISLRAEIGRPNHQHHLLIGPRGAGKTHLLRLLTAGRIPQEAGLAKAYLPLVMPEETSLRTPGDLLLKFVERLDKVLSDSSLTPSTEKRKARGICSTALTTAKAIRNPLERLNIMAEALDAAASALGKVLLPITENMDQIFYLGAQRSRQSTLDEQWALRRYLQETPHLFLIGAAPSIFGTVGDPDKPFYDFFRTHELQELTNDEVLEIIRLRFQQEIQNPGNDKLRSERVHCLLENFHQKAPHLRGLLAITGGLPRFTHLIYEVIVETDVDQVLDTLNHFLDDLTPYFQTRLDPRIFPQAEMDLLHTLALARGPRQPSELAEELYGVGTNEISELLSRLQERGLVKRAGRPGGKTVTWDLTEPVYRVWTQFRDHPEGQDLYHFLGEFVALLFNLDDIEKERKYLSDKLTKLGDQDSERKIINSRKRLLDEAYNSLSFDDIKNGSSKSNNNNIKDILIAEKLSSEFINKLNNEGNIGNIETSLQYLNKLHLLNNQFNRSIKIRMDYINGLASSIFYVGKEEYSEKGIEILNELRTLSKKYPTDSFTKKALANGFFNTINFYLKINSIDQSLILLEELRLLKNKNLKNKLIRHTFSKSLFNISNSTIKINDIENTLILLNELRLLVNKFPKDINLIHVFTSILVNAIHALRDKNDINKDLDLLNELRFFNKNNPTDKHIRNNFAYGLVNSIGSSRETEVIEKNMLILDELRKLNEENNNEPIIRRMLARGLFNMLNTARKYGDNNLSIILLNELRSLSTLFDKDAYISNSLSGALVNNIYHSGETDNFSQSMVFLDELRLVYKKFKRSDSIRKDFARGLNNIIIDSIKINNKKQIRKLLEELFHLLNENLNKDIEEIAKRSIFVYFFSLVSHIKAKDILSIKEDMSWIKIHIPNQIAEILQPMILAIDTLEKGEEQALAREPEEMRRVVRILLEQVEKE